MKGLIAFLAIVICILLFVTLCNRKAEQPTTTVFKKGLEVIKLVQGKPDTVIKTVPVHHYHKGMVKVKYDTVHHYHTATDTFTLKGVQFSIKDTLQGDSIRRMVDIKRIDSTKTITKVDTMYKTRTDTLTITKNSKGFIRGFAVGAVVGFAGGLLIK